MDKEEDKILYYESLYSADGMWQRMPIDPGPPKRKILRALHSPMCAMLSEEPLISKGPTIRYREYEYVRSLPGLQSGSISTITYEYVERLVHEKKDSQDVK